MPDRQKDPRARPGPAQSDKPKLPVHPVIASLTSGGQPLNTVAFAGYVGESDRAGNVRLYLMLNDLSQYIEFEEGAVVRTEPANRLPQKGSYIWVKADSPVRTVREAKARDVSPVLARLLGG
jgi:hypothetical protein